MMRPETKIFSIESKNGFYLGDLCYAMKDEIYDNIWGNLYNYEDGEFEVPDTGLKFAVVGTAYGDGYYESTSGKDYPVDAGIIGICPIELCKGKSAWEDLGTFVDIKGKINIFRDNEGTIRVFKDNSLLDIEDIYTGGGEYV